MTPPNAHTYRTLLTPQPWCYHELSSIQEEGQKQEQSYGKKNKCSGEKWRGGGRAEKQTFVTDSTNCFTELHIGLNTYKGQKNKKNKTKTKNRMLTSLAELSSHNLCHQYHPVLSQPDADF